MLVSRIQNFQNVAFGSKMPCNSVVDAGLSAVEARLARIVALRAEVKQDRWVSGGAERQLNELERLVRSMRNGSPDFSAVDSELEFLADRNRRLAVFSDE